MKIGTRVRMGEPLKARMRANGSGDHIEEFGDCEGVVIGLMFAHLPDCEVDVRWQPSNLRYGYMPSDLVVVETKD